MGVQAESVARVTVSVIVASIGAAAGFAHTHSAALAAGQRGPLAWADAVVIESMVIIAGLQLTRDRSAGRRPFASGLVLVIAFLIQMGSQVAMAPRTPAGWLFAALPALGCLVIVKFGLRGHPHRSTAEASEPDCVDLPSEQDTVIQLEAHRVPASVPAAPAVAAWPPK